MASNLKETRNQSMIMNKNSGISVENINISKINPAGGEEGISFFKDKENKE